MPLVHRVLYPSPIESFADYVEARGGAGLEAAAGMSPEALIETIEASGLRGRGGAGFPTGRKWRTVRDYASATQRTSVVVNAAEGEPGTFKDRSILRNDPYQVIEGALIAARAVGAAEVIFATKASFTTEVARLRAAITEVRDAGWGDGVSLSVFEGPDEYLYGEETALLEVIAGRYPLPRIAPPYRRGVREVVESGDDVDTGSGLSAHVELASEADDAQAPPTLVDNVETLANVPRIIARGADWFRVDGTEQSPGTMVCTVTGSTAHAGVGEIVMGTSLREAIELIGGGARSGRSVVAVMSGVSNRFIPASDLDVAVSYEGLAAIGSGLGSGSFVVLDDSDDVVAAAAGASRFLAVESCGQCEACKSGGLRIADHLAALSESRLTEAEFADLRARVAQVAEGARCSLATQHQTIVEGVMADWPEAVEAHLHQHGVAADVIDIAELERIEAGAAVIDERHRAKQPDWTYDERWSGQFPANRLTEHRDPVALDG